MVKIGGLKSKLLLAGLAVAFFAVLIGSVGASPKTVHAQSAPAASQTVTTPSATPAATPGRGADEKVCTTGDGLSGGLAYFLCPFTEIIAKSTQFFEQYIIVPFMTVSPLTTNDKNPIYILWSNFRDLANIGFILLMFISIFSVALSKNGAKRVLSRAFVVAIGVNLSYFGVAFIIDAFNIFGAGISQLVVAALNETTQQTGGAGGATAGTAQSIFVLGGTALVAIVASAGAALGWFFSFIMLAMLVIVAVVMILLLRQIVIIMLVILSPIAILLYMLPNTEGYFQKWRKTLVQLLLMYPMIVLLFASGKIFGIILQQSNVIQLDASVPKTIQEAVRVFLQFIVYVIPLGFLPATFAASGSLMSKGYGAISGRLTSGRKQRLREDVGLGAQELRARVASSKVPGLSGIAGSKYRRDYTRDARRRNVQRATEDYTAAQLSGGGLAGGLMRRQAAGVAGKTGQTRASAYAANVAAKGRSEDLDNEMSLLDGEMRRLGTNKKTLAGAYAKYMDDPTANVFTGANGQQFDFKANEQRLQRALLNSAADQGEVRAIETARMNSNIDQTMLDDIIRKNDGTLKGKGGYHLATDFSLAAGRGFDVSTEAGQLAAKTSMTSQRMISMSQSGANSIAGMKASVLADTADVIKTATQPLVIPAGATAEEQTAIRKKYREAVLTYNALDHNTRQQLFDRMDDIANNSNTLARSEGPKNITAMRDALQGQGFTHS